MNQQLSRRWLEKSCSFIPGAHSAVLMVPDIDANSMRILERWPADLQDAKDYGEIVKFALDKQRQIHLANIWKIDDKSYDCFALPYYVNSKLLSVIIVIVRSNVGTQDKSVFATLRQSIEWLSLASIEQSRPTQADFYSRVVKLLTACFDQQSYQKGLIRLVTELTQEFDCDRVAFSEYHSNQCQVIALSNSAGFDKRSNLLQKLNQAMEEAINQDNIVVFPNTQKKLIQRAHLELSRKFGSGAICSIPLVYQQKVFGAITLLRNENKPFDSSDIDLCQQFLTLVTAFLALKRDQDKSLLKKMGASVKQQLTHLIGVRSLSIKLITIAIVLTLGSTFFMHGDFRISADAHLEGKIQRVIAAPISGYLNSAKVRAGDTVKAGDLMASLDDSELKLQLAKHFGELQKARREYRQAQSERDLVKASIISEQINQTSAEMALTQQQLDAINLYAPFDGVIIEGDLSQVLGSPVERGETLFKVAPLQGYRIILAVNERQISYIQPGQVGTLVLSSLFNQNFPLTVERITAVATAENGANTFRVEASLHQVPDLLRPGMEGVGKINIGRERLIWIWTHDITDWVRLWVWSWWP